MGGEISSVLGNLDLDEGVEASVPRFSFLRSFFFSNFTGVVNRPI